VVVISAGDYVGDVATWRQNNLTICGAGGRARLFANGLNEGGKGIWVIAGTNVVVDSIEFHDATVPDRNGAGIRGDNSNLTVINSGFYNNENGILGPDSGDLTIHRSEFANNGRGDGFTHNIYVAGINKVTVTDSVFRQARIGHNFKSRARETRIENSYFMDGPTGTASYQIDTPDGGVVFLRGNLIQKGPNADNSTSVAYGAESLSAGTTHTLTMIHNTLVSTRSGGVFINANSGTASVTLRANLFAGNGTAKISGIVTSKIIESNTVIGTSNQITAPDNVTTPNFWPSDTTLLNQLLLASVVDATYTFDAPTRFTRRAISGSTRRVGALQAAP
jgi:hypothetical protein